jgi:hypothetical protein
MNTDLEAFVELYKRLGIDCQVNIVDDTQVIYLAEEDAGHGLTTISEKFVGGYYRFYSTVIFDLGGKFVKQNFWE